MIIQINHHCQPIDGTSVERDYPQGILFKQDSGNTQDVEIGNGNKVYDLDRTVFIVDDPARCENAAYDIAVLNYRYNDEFLDVDT